MIEQPKQLNLPGVPRAKQGREVPPHWAWTEAEVWTERMLATLERGIKGGKWYSLMDKVTKEGTLRRAAQAVIRNQGAAGRERNSSMAMPWPPTSNCRSRLAVHTIYSIH